LAVAAWWADRPLGSFHADRSREAAPEPGVQIIEPSSPLTPYLRDAEPPAGPGAQDAQGTPPSDPPFISAPAAPERPGTPLAPPGPDARSGGVPPASEAAAPVVLPAAPAPRPATVVRSVAPLVGVLIVESEPSGATVYLDGKAVGATPLALGAAPAGEHALRLELDGRARWTRAIRVVAGRRLVVSADLRPAAQP
jgi:hypothetical protein